MVIRSKAFVWTKLDLVISLVLCALWSYFAGFTLTQFVIMYAVNTVFSYLLMNFLFNHFKKKEEENERLG